MSVNTTLAGLSQTASSNGPDGSVDPPSTVDDAIRYALSFIATLRDGKGFTAQVTLASASTTDIGAQNALAVEISGTTTITSFGTTYNGPRFLRFTGALTLTHNATTLNLPGAANIVTVAGDTAIAIPNQAANGWNVVAFTRSPTIPATETSSGVVELATQAEVLTGTDTSRVPSVSTMRSGLAYVGTPVAATSGTAINFTSIPSWVYEIAIPFVKVSTSGTSPLYIQIGDSGGIENTNYEGATVEVIGGASATFSDGFRVGSSSAAAAVYHGTLFLTRENAAGTTWTISGTLSRSDGAQSYAVGGSKTLSAALDRVRITTAGGTDTFDGAAGAEINIIGR